MRSDEEVMRSNRARAVIGGSYFNPPHQVATQGRELTVEVVRSASVVDLQEESYFVASLFESLTSQLEEDELLFALYSRPSYQLAPYIVDPETLIEYELQVLKGGLKAIGFYGVKRPVASEGLRRVYNPG